MIKFVVISSLILIMSWTHVYGFENGVKFGSNTIFGAKKETKTIKIKVTGMTCAGCAGHITKALNAMDGIESIELEYPGDIATIHFDSEKTNSDQIIASIVKTGYNAKLIANEGVEKKVEQ